MSPGLKPLDRDSNGSILEYHQPVVPPGHKDYAMHELMRGLLFFELGDYVDSDMRFANACKIMEQIAGDESRETAAVVWKESSKTYRGEPYERAAAYLYRGLCRYMMGDYEGALAAFRHSLACDAETRTKEQAYLEDFTISHFLAALCYRQLREPDNAEAALRIARKYTPSNPYLDSDYLDKSFVAVIAVGQGPYLRPSKIDVSIKRVDRPDCPVAGVDVYVDGKLVGQASEATDLYVQAKSQRWGEMDTARVGKRVVQEVVSYIPFVGMAANLIRPEVDIRCWWGLPRAYYIFAVDVPAGLHTVALRCRDADGAPLPRYDQIWFDVAVRRGGGLMYFRLTRNAQNSRGMERKKIGERGGT
ncbi:MAG: hypothetical protein GWP08_15445 [Nitrospiraceae bacterium]|nr:hypothetical protein [Nitrospiraceae bacterium]